MANPHQPSGNIAYDPLPLAHDDIPSNALYNAPPSPGPMQGFSAQQTGNAGLPQDGSFIPPGAAQPRFMGQYDGGRSSYASESQPSLRTQSEYGSVYALNDAQMSSSRFNNYSDDPGYSDNVPMSPIGHSRGPLQEKQAAYAAPRAKSRRKIMIIAIIVAIILILAAVIIPLYFAVIRPKSESEANDSKDESTKGKDENKPGTPKGGNTPAKEAVVTGGDGSIITMEDGTTFVYKNPFGGTWYYDPNDPFNNGARAQSWTPALNETFNYGEVAIKGVNVGGWLLTEPFISPALYEKYGSNPVPPIDEWHLSIAMREDVAGGGISQMEEHYKTFITERDFAEMAGAGLNYVRVPIAWWAVETRGDEPFLPHVSWNYFLKAIKWCRKYGLRINLDLHALPGSQNGWNHSGRLGKVGFLHGPMGYVNAQRGLDIIRALAEFITQPQYKDVVTMFGIMNEPLGDPMTQENLARFYMESYNIIRRAGGVGEGNGPYISLHDGFYSRDMWSNTFPNADRLSLDTHPYMCFGTQSAAPMTSYGTRPCELWAGQVNRSMSAFGLTNAGEWSLAVTDCGLFLNGVGQGERYEGDYQFAATPRMGDCTEWTDYTQYTQATKDAMRQFALASMDALQNYFFWTWRIGESINSGRVETPHWSYKLGLQEGWMPADPREAVGVCGFTEVWTPPLQPWQTGGAGAGDIPAEVTERYAWPPTTIRGGTPLASLPSYTPTGAIPTLTATPITAGPKETITRTVDVGNGWNNPEDTQGWYVEVPGCAYIDPWIMNDEDNAAPPVDLCPGIPARRQDRVPEPLATMPPS